MGSNSYDKTLGLIQESISVISGIPSQKILCYNSILPHKHDCGDDMANRKDWKSEPPCVNTEAGRGKEVAKETTKVGGHIAGAWVVAFDY